MKRRAIISTLLAAACVAGWTGGPLGMARADLAAPALSFPAFAAENDARTTTVPEASPRSGAGLCGTGFQPVLCGAGFQPVKFGTGFPPARCGAGFQPVICSTGFQPVPPAARSLASLRTGVQPFDIRDSLAGVLASTGGVLGRGNGLAGKVPGVGAISPGFLPASWLFDTAPGPMAAVRTLPPLHGSATLFLSVLLSLGGWQAVRASRSISFTNVPDWYQPSEIGRIGYAAPFDRFELVRSSGMTGQRESDERLRQALECPLTAFRCTFFTFMGLSRVPRGPPVPLS